MRLILFSTLFCASIIAEQSVRIDADVLFWQSSVDGLNYAVKSKSTTFLDDATIKAPTQDWDWGFRLGLGYHLPRDKWDLLATYTRMQAHASGHDDGVLFPSWGGAFVPSGESWYVQSGSAHWNANLNMLDVELGRDTQAGKHLTLRPLMGVRTLFLNQHYHLKYKGGNQLASGEEDRIHLQSDFWGVGLRLGVDSVWNIARGWGIYGNGSISLLSGHFNVKERETQKPEVLRELEWRQDVDPLVVAADLALGVQWDYLFSKDRYHFGMKLGWEFNVFFDQNQQIRWVGDSIPGFVISEDGDLSFQGVTLGFRFDF